MHLRHASLRLRPAQHPSSAFAALRHLLPQGEKGERGRSVSANLGGRRLANGQVPLVNGQVPALFVRDAAPTRLQLDAAPRPLLLLGASLAWLPLLPMWEKVPERSEGG